MTVPNFQNPPDIKQKVMEGEEGDYFSRMWYQWFTKLVAKLNAITAGSSLFVPKTRTIGTVPPLTGGGDLVNDLTLSITGITAVIATAKLTGGGSNGTMTFTNGVLTAHVDAT